MLRFKTNTIIAICMLFLTAAYAQDGAGLFKSKCNTCHMVDKNSTGPNLKGAKQKWADAGEGDMIYEWVMNPQTLIASGKSKMAAAIKGFSPTDMTPQQVSKEEIDAILDYVDTYVAAAPTTPTATTGGTAEPVIEIVPNYEENLSLFYWLLAGGFILIVAIIIMANSISNLIKSDFFKEKLAKKNDNSSLKNLVLLVGIFGLLAVSQTASALTFNGPGEATEGLPWLVIENGDIYALVAIDIILLLVLLYLRRMFNEFLNMIRSEKQKAAQAGAVAKKVNAILTDAVPVEEEASILMHHEYDGIRELDNNLPPWWVWGFVTTVVFAIVYILNYHVFKTSNLQTQEYQTEMQQADKEVKEYLSKMAMNVDETNATLMTNESDLSAGKALFETNCVVCHKSKGEGDIGPNLTDDAWLYGNDIKDVFYSIKKGRPNGMPEHASKLNPIQLQQVSSYVLSLPFTKGKDPQGTVIPKK